MKKNIMMFVSIVMILICAFVITSCRVPGPGIAYQSVQYVSDTEVKLYWDYENRAKPFKVSIRRVSNPTFTVVATNLEAPPVTRTVVRGRTYVWRVTGANGDTAKMTFTVP
jgi:hypothetical protein